MLPQMSSRIPGTPESTLLAPLLALLSLLGSSALPATAQVQHPLEPAVTSSPRETLTTFLQSSEAIWSLVRDAGTEQRSGAGLQELREHDIRTRRTLDLREVAPKARLETAHDVQVYLYEVLSRIQLPPMNEVPNDADILQNPSLEVWTIPHTEIHIRRVTEGPRRGEFLFAPETVARAEEFHDRTQSLPYVRQPPIENLSSFLQVYGGWNIPLSTVDALPSSLRRVVWDQAWWKWIVLVLAALFNLAVVYLVHRATRRGSQPRTAWRYLLRLLVPATLFASATAVVSGLIDQINVNGAFAHTMQLAATAVAYLSLAWGAWLLALAVGEALSSRSSVRTESLDASLIRLTAQVVGLGCAIALIFRGASQIGLPLVGLVAGISVGGLAIALAAQDTLKSLLGSLMILVDQPYKVGDRILASGHDGVVERIGLRSTRIRQLDGHLTTIPNESMATMEVENIGRRESIRRKSYLRIASGTPREKVEEALTIVRTIVADHEGMAQDKPPRVHFLDFNPDSLKIVIFCWYHPADYWAFCEFSERTNLEIVRRFGEADILLAPPTSRTELVST